MSSAAQAVPVPVARRDARAWLFAVAALVIALDRATKLWIIANIKRGQFITLIPNVFRLSHVHNTGAAFSMFEQIKPELLRGLLISFSVLAILVVSAMIWRVGRTFSVTGFALALILGGAIGNLYDRWHFKYVVDFLQVFLYHYHWPDFNVADSSIVVGACLLLIEIFRNQPQG